MTNFYIYDVEGNEYFANLVNGTPEVVMVNDFNSPVFPFLVRVINSLNTIFWLLDGEYHRLDGPAIEYAWGTKNWYVDGNRVDKSDYPAAVEEFLASGVEV